ncbi:MAG: MFS transporter [Amphiplicatus sp.]
MLPPTRPLELFRPIAGLLCGAALLFVGQGVFLILVPLRLAADHLSAPAISLVGSAYFAGIITGAWFGDRIIRAVGNIRAYGAFIALILCACLSLALVGGATGWAIMRFLHGAAAAGAFLAIESWLHAATPNQWRGRVVGAYTALSLAGLGAGQLLINAYGANAVRSIDLGALLFAASIAPVMLSKAVAPPLAPMSRRPLMEVYRHSPVGTAGCFCAGLSMGAFWALGPVFAARSGMSPQGASLFMATTVFGGLALVWPFGRLSDLIDRRLILAGVGFLGTGARLALVTLEREDALALLALSAAYGGVIFSLYPLALSQAADHVSDGQDMLEITRGLLLANGLGMTVGPLIGAQVIARAGPYGLFLFTAAVTAGISALALWRALRRAPTPPEQRKAFIPMPETTPAALPMDPRIPEAQPELALHDRA